tara:strand:- start:339 stop:827 length:489 start_codon:yes stop_codon:yes gene_type:complete
LINNNVFLSLGSNIGDRKLNIERALIELRSVSDILATSSIYKTEPMGFTNQEEFYNCILEVKTKLSPKKLLYEIKKIERRMGRKKNFRNGPRLIDIDIIFYKDSTINEEELIIPHPRWQERLFVITPMFEISPDLTQYYIDTFNIELSKLKQKVIQIGHVNI